MAPDILSILTFCLCCLHITTSDYQQSCFLLNDVTYVDRLVCFVTSVSAYDATVRSIPAEIEALNLICNSYARSSYLSPDIFGRFTSLRSLGIGQCNVTSLTASSFRGLSNLVDLSIGSSILPELGEDAFEHLPSLEVLTIVETNMKKLPSLSHMTSLRRVNVSFNALQEVTDRPTNSTTPLFHHDLTEVDLSYNSFASVPMEILRGTSSLRKLYLKGLTAVSGLHFPADLDLGKLTILHADGTNFKTVDISRLEAATHIEELRLCGKGNPPNFPGFNRWSSLEELSLNNFAINDSIWSELNSTRLARLDMTKNNLTLIDLSRLPALRLIRLAENNISELAEDAFYGQPGLLLLNVSFNNLATLPGILFYGNPNLKALILNNNKLQYLNRSTFSSLQQLFYLDLSFNQIQITDQDVFGDLISITLLNLQGNNLVSLPTVTHMPYLHTLNVSFNNISQIADGRLDGLDSLEFFDANDNRLTFVVPHMVTRCPNLLSLNLHNNQITDVGTFGAHPSLMMIRLDNNSITDFESISPFVDMKRLLFLFLDQNKLKTVRPNWFPVSITSITLGANEISEFFSTSFKNLNNLTFVNLYMNKVALSMPSYSVNVFKANSPKPVFEMKYNTFLCSCNLADIKVIMEDGYVNNVFNNNYPKFVGLETSQCVTTYGTPAVRPMVDVPLSHFACRYEGTICDITCLCCYSLPDCPCALTCPESCTCYHAGSGFKRYYFHIHCDKNSLQSVPNGIPSRATSVYLDGNILNNLTRSALGNLERAEVIYLNASDIVYLEDGLFDNMTSLLVLRLEYNRISEVSEFLFAALSKLIELYLNDNRISFIPRDAFSGLKSAEHIALHNNRLIMLEAVYGVSSLKSVTLAGNPWQCQCNASTDVLRVFHALNDIIQDRERMCCYVTRNRDENREFATTAAEVSEVLAENPGGHCYELLTFPYRDVCVPRADNVTTGYIKQAAESLTLLISLIVAVFILLLLTIIVLVVIFKGREVQAWVYVNVGIRVYDKKAVIDKEDAGTKYFDAFISYSSKDSEFVSTVLVPALDEKRYRICVHYRDFPVGQNIVDTIFRAIERSSRTILLLSRNFLESEWCRFEFQTAHHHILKEGSHRLVIVLLDDIPDDMLDPDLKVQLKSKTYLKYDDPWFWEKLYFALPNVREKKEGRTEDDILKGMRILAGQKPEPEHKQTDKIIQLDIKEPADISLA
ncbi:hypothetical protein Btru_020064 [Bulinus truncatus]|nr:hypothetical protein Btru_020064 [Bulinus truncatus]